MNKLCFKFTLLYILTCLISSPVFAAVQPLVDKSIFDQGYPEAAPSQEKNLTFEDLNRPNMRLRGVQSSASIDFTNRLDHIITDVSLDLAYSHSPSLIPGLSHIKVYLNEEIMTIIPIQELDKVNPTNGFFKHQIPLNPKLISDFNTIRLELIGHYTMECEDPFHSSIWAEISKNSRITYSRKQLPIESQLGKFPVPFFDPRDYDQLNLPFLFKEVPDIKTTQAAAILASWFGSQAHWRGSKYPIIINEFSAEHSVVFATNDNKPDFLKDYPDVKAPTVEIISNPIHRYQKMLLILGRDTDDLKVAVEGLVAGQAMMTGRTAQIDKVEYLQPRKAYDAPRWLRSDREVTFGELIDYPTQLQVKGYNAAPVKLDINLPPDLFTWRKGGIPIDLKYRYTPPTHRGESRLNMSINDEYVQGYKLSSKQFKGITEEDIKIPLLSTDDTDKDRYFTVPGFKVDIKNELAFQFIFSTEKEGACTTSTPEGTIAVIDDGSTIDISDYEHYTAMPDLHAFSQSGFPFSKFADLSETLVLMPSNYSKMELETLFSLMGHMGSSTGYPAINAQITTSDEKFKSKDKDIIIIGDNHKLIKENTIENSQLTALVEESERIIRQAIYETEPLKYAKSNHDASSRVTLNSYGTLAVIAGFQSPLTDERSVVALMAANEDSYSLLIDSFASGSKLAEIAGTAAIITEHNTHKSYVGERYYVGQLPVFQLIWFHLSEHPILLALLSILTLVLLSFILWRVLNSLAYNRLAKQEGR